MRCHGRATWPRSGRRAGADGATVLYWRIAAVAFTAMFVALLVWSVGVRTALIWAGAMAAFLLVLWAVTIPLRARRRRVWREMGLGPDGRPLPEEEDEDDV